MYNLKSVSVAAMGLVVWAALSVTDVSAQSRGRGRPGGGAMGGAAMRAVPRTGRPINRGFYPSRLGPRVGDFRYRPYYRSFNRPYYQSFNRPFYRPYYRPYFRPGISVGFGVGYPYRYSYYGYPYNYPYNYTYFHDYRDSYPYAPYTYASYVTAVPGYGYGGVRITGAPDNAQVFVDGQYVGKVDNFDGTFQHMNLRAGSHHIEIRGADWSPVTFNVNVTPGQTTTYRAGIR
jgi:hypothetical protein